MTDRQETLAAIFRSQAVRYGQFTLSSGAVSSYYVDLMPVLLDGMAIYLLGLELDASFEDVEFTAIGGPATGAIPLVTSAAIAMFRRGKTVRGFFVRPESKTHGPLGKIEGRLHPGDRVVLLEDVVTTGQSVLKAIRAVEAAGATVVRVFGLVDRLAGADHLLKAYDYRTLFNVSQLLREGAT